MTTTDQLLKAAYSPIRAPLVGGLIATIGTTAAVLFTDLPQTTPPAVRRIRIVNTHATQTLALFFVAAGTAAASQAVTSLNALLILPRTSESLLVEGTQRIIIVGSAAATTFQAVTADRK